MQLRGFWWPRSVSSHVSICQGLGSKESRRRGPDRLSFHGRLLSRTLSRTVSNAAPELSPLQAQRLKRLTVPQIYRSTSSNPFINLAIEHYLFEISHPESRILFLYTNKPCVVIGRNQNPWVECDFARLRRGLPHTTTTDGIEDRHHGRWPIEFVRRRSGGGTVFHDEGNLNYSVIVPNDKYFARRTHGEMVVKALNSVELTQSGSGVQRSGLFNYEEVKVNDRNDIVGRPIGQDTWFKVSGSAFKLTRLRALHHGTLLHSSPYIHQISALLSSPARDRIKAMGVESVRSPVGNLAVHGVNPEILRTAIETSIAREWSLKYGSSEHMTEVNEGDCSRTADAKLSSGFQELMSPEWLYEQTPRFEFQGDGKDLDCKMEVKNGRVKTIRINDDVLQRLCEETLLGKKLHEITDWQGTFTGVVDGVDGKSKDVAVKLLALMQEHFPPVPFPGDNKSRATDLDVREPTVRLASSEPAAQITRPIPGAGEAAEVERQWENLVEDISIKG